MAHSPMAHLQPFWENNMAVHSLLDLSALQYFDTTTLNTTGAIESSTREDP